MNCPKCGTNTGEETAECPRCQIDRADALRIPPPENSCPERRLSDSKVNPFLIFLALWIAAVALLIYHFGPTSSLTLILMAIAPPVSFMSFILYMDRREPEPLGVVLKAIGLGALAAIPAAAMEIALGGLPLFHQPGLSGAAIDSFLMIAPVEEAAKLGAVIWFVWKSPCFNEENDGIVYVGASAIGFAMLENLLFVLGMGFATGLTRALTAIPLHTFTGVIMGYFVGLARFNPARKVWLITWGFFLAYFIHAVYDTLGMSNTRLGLLMFPTVVILSVAGIIYLNRGRALSLRRWRRKPSVPPELSVKPVEKPGGQRWKIFLSRSLFGLSGVFWAAAASCLGDRSCRLTWEDFFTGGITFTFIPVLVGILLEISYRRWQTGDRYRG